MCSIAGLIRQTPSATFRDTVTTDRHPDTTISSSGHTSSGFPCLVTLKNCSDMCCRWGSNPLHERRALNPLGQAPAVAKSIKTGHNSGKKGWNGKPLPLCRSQYHLVFIYFIYLISRKSIKQSRSSDHKLSLLRTSKGHNSGKRGQVKKW